MTIEAKSLFKGIFLIILALVVFTGATSADLFDTEIVTDNKLTATTLDFSQRDTANENFNSQLFNITGLVSGGFQVEGVRVKKDGLLDFNYKITTVKTAGDDLFCSALELTVVQNWQIKYQGRAMDFQINSTIQPNGLDDWLFYLNLVHNEVSLTNKVCDFNFIFRSLKINEGGTSMFFDEEILLNHVSSGLWVPP